MRLSKVLAALLPLLSLPALAEEQRAVDAPARFQEFCASCHGADRLGGKGPALLPENLSRLRKPDAIAVIGQGRALTQMPGYAAKLSPAEIEALAAFVYTPLPSVPVWGEAEMRATHVIPNPVATLPDKPAYTADPLNLFVVVEAGDSHVTILDGDKLEPLHSRFESRFALHGGPKFSPDGRFVYFASRDGWITKFDLYSLKVVAEIRAGINTRNLAISGDGKVLAVGNFLPNSLVFFDALDLSPLKVVDVRDAKGQASSRISAVYQAAPRNAFVVALKDVAELWEISWLDNPPPVYAGLVHNYEEGMVEAQALKGRFPIRRIALGQPLDDFFFTPGYHDLVGSARDGGKAVVVNLDVGREIGMLELPGLPHLGSGISWEHDGRMVLATPDLKEGAVSIIDMKEWKVVKRIPTLGPGFFLRSHDNTPYAWADCSFSKDRDALQIIDKRSLEVVATLRPEPGKTASHVEFTRDGKFALVSISEMDGALVIIDAATLKEVKRLPMRKPSGKYNVYNKITLSPGTSH